MSAKKSYRSTIIVISILLVIMTLTISFFFMGSKKSHEEVLLEYYSKIIEKDYEGMYEMISSQSKDTYDQESFINRNKKIYEGIEVSDIQVNVLSDRDDELKYYVNMSTLAGHIQFENKTKFSDDKIIWNDTFIFPELAENFKVSVSTDKAQRGKILDRNHVTLAKQGEAYSVGLVRQKLDGEKDYDKIGELLDLTKEDIQKAMSASWVKDDSFVPIKTILKSDLSLNQKLVEIPGVMLSTVEVRTYPYDKVTSHVVGYMQKVTAEDLEKHKGEGYTENSYIGRTGIEAAYEKQLKGEDGVGIYIIDENGTRIVTLAAIEKKDGQDIILTLDIQLQESLYEAFSQDKSASVAMNPQTGEILALVSTPSFNSHSFILGMTTQEWNSLNEDENRPLYNRFGATWVPGSSMKTITAAIGLNAESLDVSEDFHAQMKWQKDSSWGSYYVTTLHAPKPNNLKNALIYSDNVYFAKAALKIGRNLLEQGYKSLMIGEKIPFELSLTPSQYAKEELKDDLQIADSGYGQGEILMNPVHLASLYSGIVNDGNIMTPHVVQSTKSSIWIKSAYTRETITNLKEALIGVVNDPHGTGYALKNNRIKLAGKTGTGEIKASQDDTSGTEIGWMTVMSTNQDLPFVVTTMVEDVKDRGGSSYVVNHLKKPIKEYINQGR